MISIIKILFTLFILVTFSSCTLYKSEGRKNFETQSPGQIRTLSLVGCAEIQNAEAYEPMWTPNGHEVHIYELNQEIQAEVALRNEGQQKFCTYRSPNQESWLFSREIFFAEIDALKIDL